MTELTRQRAITERLLLAALRARDASRRRRHGEPSRHVSGIGEPRARRCRSTTRRARDDSPAHAAA